MIQKEATDKSDLIAKAKKYIFRGHAPDPSLYDMPCQIAASADGSYFTDIQGNRYLDLLGIAAQSVGYNNPEILEAIQEQMKQLCANPGVLPANPQSILLAEKLASLSPGDMTRTVFGSNGTDAIDTALKMARIYFKLTGKATKYKFITCRPSYHGLSFTALAAGGTADTRCNLVEPLPSGFIHIPKADCYRCAYRLTYPECDLHCATDLRRVIELEDASTVAAVMMDQSSIAAGFQPPPPGYMKTIRKICDEYDILLIIDEVLTGMGKTGTWFECLQHDFTPDIMCLAKTLAGSHLPLSACHVREKIAEPLMTDPGGGQVFSYSFMGFPPCCAAAIANIKVIEENNVLDGVVKKSAFALSELKEIKERLSIVGDVQASGLGLGIRLVKDRETKEKFTPDEVTRVEEIIFGYAVEHGVVLYPEEVQGDSFIFMFPALTITEKDLKFGLDTAAGAIEQIQKEFGLG